MASPDLYPLSEAIETAFMNSEVVAAEFDVTTVNDTDMLNLTMEKARYPRGENLYSNIPNDLYQKADELLEEMGGDILLFNTFEPWAVAMEIEAMQLIQYGYSPENGIDIYFLDRAHLEGKRIAELESAQFQLELLDTLPEDLQLFLLEDAVSNPLTEKELEQMFEAWESGDLHAMEQLAIQDEEDSPELEEVYKILIDDRNISMTEKIVTYLEDTEDYFVVVGAGHLTGDSGIINLLQNNGYSPVQL